MGTSSYCCQNYNEDEITFGEGKYNFKKQASYF